MAITLQKAGIGKDKDGNTIGYTEFRCLSTDTLPTNNVSTNSLALVLDSGDIKYFNGTEWKVFGGAS